MNSHKEYVALSEKSMEIQLSEQVPLGKKTAFLLKNVNLLPYIKQNFGILTHNFQEPKDRHVPRDHLVTFHITNVHWFLFFTQIEGQPYCIAINRNDKNHYVIDMFENMPKTLYNDTIIAGEVFGQYFFVNDLLVFEGNRYFYLQQPLMARLNVATRILSNLDVDRDRSPFTFATKTYFYPDVINNPQALNISLAKYGVSKFRYFVYTPYAFSRFPNSYMIKLRVTDIRPNSNRETIDPNQKQTLTIMKSETLPDVYKVSLRAEKEVDLGYACVVDRDTSLALKRDFETETEKTYVCIFNRQFKKWQPLTPIKAE